MPYPEKNIWYMAGPNVPTINPSIGPNRIAATKIGKASKVNLKLASLIGVNMLKITFKAINIAQIVSLCVFINIILV